MIECPRCKGKGTVDIGAPGPNMEWPEDTCPTCQGNGQIVSVRELRAKYESKSHYYPCDVAAWYYYYGPRDHPFRDLNYTLAYDQNCHKNDLLGLIEYLEVWEKGNQDTRIKELEELVRLAIETLDDDAPGPGTTEKDLLRRMREALNAEADVSD